MCSEAITELEIKLSGLESRGYNLLSRIANVKGQITRLSSDFCRELGLDNLKAARKINRRLTAKMSYLARLTGSLVDITLRIEETAQQLQQQHDIEHPGVIVDMMVVPFGPDLFGSADAFTQAARSNDDVLSQFRGTDNTRRFSDDPSVRRQPGHFRSRDRDMAPAGAAS